MFIRDKTLEECPYIIDKKICNYKAYSKGIDIGFTILVFSDYVELYEYDNGPYRFCGKYRDFESAVIASENDFT